MAAATVGVCLGCVCGISLTLVAGRWLQGHVADLNAVRRYLYYATFLTAIGWALLRGAGRAAVHLSWLAAACALAVPLTSLLAWSVPELGLWRPTDAGTLGVDATALVGALCFARVARATSLRVRHGSADSVWSQHGGATTAAIAAPAGQA